MQPFFRCSLLVLFTLITLLGSAPTHAEETVILAPNAKQLQQVLPVEAHNKGVYIEFKSKFCAACQQIKPQVETLVKANPQVYSLVLDINKDAKTHQAIFEAFKPTVVPVQVFIGADRTLKGTLLDVVPQETMALGFKCISTNTPADCEAFKMAQTHSGNPLDYCSNQLGQLIQSKPDSMITILISFLAGLVTSFFPCNLGMLPVMVGYIGGYADNNRHAVLLQCLALILGLATVTTGLGVALSLLGKTFGQLNNPIVYALMGVFCIGMGAVSLGWWHIPNGLSKLPQTEEGKLLSFYGLGALFGLVASPCGTPALAAILTLVARNGNPIIGGLSLFAYALGQGVVLLAAGLFTGLLKYRSNLFHLGHWLNQGFGVLLLLTGLWLIKLAF